MTTAIGRRRRSLWTINRSDGRPFIVRSDELLSAFLELEWVTRDARGLGGSFRAQNRSQ
jgi:hypothetical protein